MQGRIPNCVCARRSRHGHQRLGLLAEARVADGEVGCDRDTTCGTGGDDAEGRVAFTGPALLAGLGVLLPMLELLRTHDVNDLRKLADQALPGLLRREGG